MNLYCHRPQTGHSRSIPILGAAWTEHLCLWQRDQSWAREVWRFLFFLSGFLFPSLSPSWSSLWAEKQRAPVGPHPLRLALVLVVHFGLPVVLILVGEASGLHNEVAAAAIAVQEDTEIDERRNVKLAVVVKQAAASGEE